MAAPMHHTHTLAIALSTLFVGVILGAAGGYYAGQFQTALMNAISGTAQQSPATQIEQASSTSAAANAAADSYGTVTTNPLQDVQTNPFQ